MARLTDSTRKGLHRAAEAVKRIFSREQRTPDATGTASVAAAPDREAETRTARPVRRDAEIPLDVLNRTYTPARTSSKSSFRSDGSDHQQDQDLPLRTSDDRWNDEDHFTNKSGDPRIGTHGRSYEANEDAAGIRNERR